MLSRHVISSSRLGPAGSQVSTQPCRLGASGGDWDDALRLARLPCKVPYFVEDGLAARITTSEPYPGQDNQRRNTTDQGNAMAGEYFRRIVGRSRPVAQLETTARSRTRHIQPPGVEIALSAV